MDDLGSLTSAISIVMGILTYFLALVLERCRALLAEDLPAVEQEIARQQFRGRLLRLLMSGAGPMLIAFGVLFYLCLPTTTIIIRSSKFELWHFDLLRTLFVFLELTVGACSVLSGVSAVRLIRTVLLTLSH